MTAHEILRITTPGHQALLSITRQVQEGVNLLGMREGIVHLFSQHTTCGLTINESADPDVATDLIRRLEQLVPWHDPEDRHMEGNTAAHLRTALVGSSVTIPVHRGKLVLGTWQGIFLAEFDGPRTRHITLSALSAPPPA